MPKTPTLPYVLKGTHIEFDRKTCELMLGSSIEKLHSRVVPRKIEKIPDFVQSLDNWIEEVRRSSIKLDDRSLLHHLKEALEKKTSLRYELAEDVGNLEDLGKNLELAILESMGFYLAEVYRSDGADAIWRSAWGESVEVVRQAALEQFANQKYEQIDDRVANLFKPGSIIDEVDPNDLIPSKKSLEIYGQEEEISDLIASFEAFGFFQEPSFYLLVTPQREVLSGNRRRRAAIQLGIKVGVVVREQKDMDEAYLVGGNVYRNKQSRWAVISKACIALDSIEKQAKKNSSRTDGSKQGRTSQILSQLAISIANDEGIQAQGLSPRSFEQIIPVYRKMQQPDFDRQLRDLIIEAMEKSPYMACNLAELELEVEYRRRALQLFIDGHSAAGARQIVENEYRSTLAPDSELLESENEVSSSEATVAPELPHRGEVVQTSDSEVVQTSDSEVVQTSNSEVVQTSNSEVVQTSDQREDAEERDTEETEKIEEAVEENKKISVFSRIVPQSQAGMTNPWGRTVFPNAKKDEIEQIPEDTPKRLARKLNYSLFSATPTEGCETWESDSPVSRQFVVLNGVQDEDSTLKNITLASNIVEENTEVAICVMLTERLGLLNNSIEFASNPVSIGFYSHQPVCALLFSSDSNEEEARETFKNCLARLSELGWLVIS